MVDLACGEYNVGDGFATQDSYASGLAFGNTGYARFTTFSFDASRCSDRYGSYTEVNPLYNSCKFFIKY